MRLLVVLVAVGLFVATCSAEATIIKFTIAAHCPSSKFGSWTGDLFREKINGDEIIVQTHGTTSENFVFVELEGDITSPNERDILWIEISGDCEAKEVSAGSEPGIPIQNDKGSHYGFRVYNMENKDDNTDSKAYEYLFMKYLEKDCEKNECKESSREYVTKGCDFFKKESEQCMKGYDDTLQKYCQKEGPSTHSICSEFGSTTTSTKMILIIGGVVGAIIILVLAIGVFFYCRKKKKSKQNVSGTMSGSTATSGTTKQSTATNNLNTGTSTGTPTTTGAATGVERY